MNWEEFVVGEIPQGWYVLWDPYTFESIMWTTEVHQQYVFPEEWFEMLTWAQSGVGGMIKEEKTDYDTAKAAIRASLVMGLEAEFASDLYFKKELDQLRNSQLDWIAAWLASEGFGSKE